MAHHRTDLELRVDKPQNVYRYIEAWETVPSHHGPNVYYLIFAGIFQWEPDRSEAVRAIAIAMQYSTTIGKQVDVSQPVHILPQDLTTVLEHLSAFSQRFLGQPHAPQRTASSSVKGEGQ